MQCFVCYSQSNVHDRPISCLEYRTGQKQVNQWPMCTLCHSCLEHGDTYVGWDESDIMHLIINECLQGSNFASSQMSVPLSFPRSPSPLTFDEDDFVRSRAPSPETDDSDKEN